MDMLGNIFCTRDIWMIKVIIEIGIFIWNITKIIFNIDDIYSKASKNRIKGEILTVDNEKVTIVISVI